MKSAAMAKTVPLCPDRSGGGRGERAGAFVSGALSAGLLAAALMFSASQTQARNECGTLASGAATCSDQAYANGIRYDTGNGFDAGIAGPVTLTVTGGPATTITGAPSSLLSWERGGIIVRAAPQGSGDSTSRAIALTVGAGGNAVAIVSRPPGSILNDGVNVDQHGTAADGTTVTLGSGVRIGTETAPMEQYGVTMLAYNANNSGDHSVTSAATIHSAEVGLLLATNGSGNVIVTNTGSITTSPTGGRGSSSKHGIYVFDWSHRPQDLSYGGTSRTADTTATVTNTGSIAVSHAEAHGIKADAHGLGLYRIVNSGSGARGITASGANGRGVFVDARYHTGAAGSAAVEIENSGRITTSGANGHGVYVETVGGAEEAFQTGQQHKGNVAVTNSGSISSANHAIFVNADMGAISVTHSGGSITSTAADGIRIQQDGTGDAAVTVSSGAGITSSDAGIYADLSDADNAAGQVKIAQSGTIMGRKGIYAAVSRASAEGETRAASARPLIDIAWTGTFSDGPAATRNGGARFAATASGGTSARLIVVHDEVPEAETEKATRYGTAAGIEAHALSWRAAATEVAKGDDPGVLDRTAQTALFDANADAATKGRAAIILAAFRAQLDSPGAIPNRNTIDTDNDEVTSDDEITAYLTEDSDDRRTFLRNILAEHLSEKEQAVLRAVVTNAGLDNALNDAGFSDAYKTAVRALLNRHNVGDIRVAMNGGAIRSQGDGIRAYYATRHDGNGAIDVTVDKGATVNGGRAGVYVANAGDGLRIEKKYAPQDVQDANEDLGPDDFVTLTDYLDQVVRVDGAVTGGTDAAVLLAGGGALIVSGTGKLVAGSSGRAVLANGPGPAVVHIEGEAEGDIQGGDLTATVAGTVDGNIRGGALRLSVLEGGVVTGTVHDPVGPLTVAGSIGRLLYSGGATVTVGPTGRLGGVDGETEALRSEGGHLDVTVAGTVDGDIRTMGAGTLTLSVPEGGVVEGALRSDGGDLDVTVAGMVTGDILGLGAGDHAVRVAQGGVVTGTIRLAASTVTVDGTVGKVQLDRGGKVAVGRTGRIAGIEGVGVRSETGDFTATIAGIVGGDVRVLGSGEHAVTVEAGGQVTGCVCVATRSDVTLGGSVGKVQLDRGGMVTIGKSGRVTGLVGDDVAIRSGASELAVVIQQAADETAVEAANRVQGRIEKPDGRPEVLFQAAGSAEPQALGAPGTWSSAPSGAFDVGVVPDEDGVRLASAYAPRSRVYEALPSALLGLNRLPEFRERAVRASRGGWAQVEAFRGKWDAARSTTPGLEYSYRRHGLRAGFDSPVTENALFGVSVHRRGGSVDVPDGGRIDLSGNGVGAFWTSRFADAAYMDLKAEWTWYEADFFSSVRGALKKARARGHALGVEIGRRATAGELVLTPRIQLARSTVSANGFTDAFGARMSPMGGRSLTGAAGVAAELDAAPGTRAFGALDAEREFSAERKVRVSGEELRSSADAMWFRLRLGGAHAWNDGRYAFRGWTSYATAGDSDELGGGFDLTVRF